MKRNLKTLTKKFANTYKDFEQFMQPRKTGKIRWKKNDYYQMKLELYILKN